MYEKSTSWQQQPISARWKVGAEIQLVNCAGGRDCSTIAMLSNTLRDEIRLFTLMAEEIADRLAPIVQAECQRLPPLLGLRLWPRPVSSAEKQACGRTNVANVTFCTVPVTTCRIVDVGSGRHCDSNLSQPQQEMRVSDRKRETSPLEFL